ncbi:MAG: magnesium transporter [Burkholderiaceae bacterium]|nr:magnesium transporter [Burkholderiaceae bacterium]
MSAPEPQPNPEPPHPAPDAEALPTHPDTAGEHLVLRVLHASPHENVGALRRRLADGVQVDSAEAVYLLDDRRHLLGLVPMRRLLGARPEQILADIATAPVPAVRSGADQEHVASLAIQHGLTSMPVVDRRGHLAGVVPPLALLEVLRREHVEDLHRFAGIGPEESGRAREAIEAPPIRRARDRLPWLLVGLVGSMLATFIVAGFEAALEARVAIAFFVPGIVYLADAVGTQSEAIAVRGLSLSRLPLARLLAGELRTGLLIGITLALLVLGPIWWWFGDADLAVAVAVALLAASTCATTIGFALPWLLARTGRDPAFGSGPIATIIQDMLSLLIYFWTVKALLF